MGNFFENLKDGNFALWDQDGEWNGNSVLFMILCWLLLIMLIGAYIGYKENNKPTKNKRKKKNKKKKVFDYKNFNDFKDILLFGGSWNGQCI